MNRLNINTILLATLLSMAGITAEAHDIEEDNGEGTMIFYSWTDEDHTALEVVSNGDGWKYGGDVVIPASVNHEGESYPVTRIGDQAFYECRELKSVTIPESVTAIGKEAFYECDRLNSVTIPEGVTAIGNQAFGGCNELTSVIIPGSMATIGEAAFQNCNKLNSISCYAEEPPAMESENAFEGSVYFKATLRVPAGSVGNYQNTAPWSNFRNITSLKCATPTIVFENGRLSFECATEGVEFEATITPSGNQSVTGSTLFLADVPVRYRVVVYAQKAGYLRSDGATRDITYQMKRGDANSDGSVTIADAIKLAGKVLEQ